MIILCHPNNRPAVVEGFRLQGVVVNEDGTTSRKELTVRTVPLMNERDEEGKRYVLALDDEQLRQNMDLLINNPLPCCWTSPKTNLFKVGW